MGQYLDLLRDTGPAAVLPHIATGDISDESAKRAVRSLLSLISQPEPCATEAPAPSAPALPAAPDRAVAVWGEAEEERAAIVEHDGGIPRAWAEGYARLHPDRPPADVPQKRWQQFVDDVGHFLDHWADYAAALGWGPHELFGCDRDRPFARIDQAGLLWLLNGDRLIALSENTATFERRTGARQAFRRRPFAAGQVVLAWELVP